MLTSDQRQWIDHLSDTKTVSIVPFDPTCEEKYLKIKTAVQKILGPEQDVVHSGASSLRISGQDEIDVYVPVPESIFALTVDSLKIDFGEPSSIYPLKRAHFSMTVDGKHVDVFVINRENAGWKESVIFMSYLRSHSDELERYRQLKENAAGQSIREYYRIKLEFINTILEKSTRKINSG